MSDPERSVVDASGAVTVGGVVGPQDRRPVRTEMPLREFHASGLLRVGTIR